MKKLGIVIDSIETSHRALVMNHAIAEAIQKRWFDDIVVFYNNVGPNMMAPPCAYMHVDKIHGFDGVVLVADLVDLKFNADFFYVWELAWLKEGLVSHYDKMAPYYTRKGVVYATRSESYAAILKNNFNMNVEIISEDFNLEKFSEYTDRRCSGYVLQQGTQHPRDSKEV